MEHGIVLRSIYKTMIKQTRTMKKILKMLVMTSVVMVTMFFVSLPTSASGDYVVSDIATNGTITVVNSYSTFDEAKTVMLTYPNGIVTHSASLSPSKIIAMTRGVAVSYSFRYGTLSDTGYTTYTTMTITQYETTSGTQKTTYIPSHYDMQYLGTTSYNSSTGNGRVYVIISGFKGYADLQQVDLVPMVYIENNLPITLGGNTFNPSYETPFVLSSPKQVQFVVSGNELIFKRWSFYNGDLRNNVAIGIKADWMVDGATYYSYDFNNFYTDRLCTNLAGTYYNYYQYLPLRSKTNITAAQLNAYLATKKSTGVMLNAGNLFLNAEDTYGANALLVYAIACQESSYGTSSFAVERYNLFGINAVDSDPSQAYTFTTVEACIDDMTGWFLRGYMNINDTRFFGSNLGDKGSGFNVKYASDPYWGVQIAAIAYSIDKSANLVDYNYYSVGVINEYNVAVKSAANSSSSTWYTSAYGATYQNNFTVILNRLVNGYYEVPTTNPIVDDTVFTLGGVRQAYDFLESLGYIEQSKITVLSNSVYNASSLPSPITLTLYPEYITSGKVLHLNDFSFDANGLDISGYGFNKGVATRSLANVSHTLVFKNTTTSEEVTFTLGDGALDSTLDTTYATKDLSFVGSTFSSSNIDLSTLANGEYEVLIRTTYSSYLDAYDTNIDLASVPDVSAITPSLVFSETDNKLYLTVSNEIEGELTASINVFDWGTGENSNKLFIQGIAAIKGVDHNEKNRVTHKLVLKNISDSTEYEFILDTYSGDELGTYNIELLDDHSYYYAWYSGYVDISLVPVGNYQARIETEIISSDGYTTYYASMTLKNSIVGNIPSLKTVDGNVVRISKNGRSLSRYEISIIDGLDELYTAISKPTSRITYTEVNSLTINNGAMNLQGIMYLYSIDQDMEQMPEYKLYLVSNGAVAMQTNLTTTDGAYNITSSVNSGNDYTYSWYEGSDIDLSLLANGTYDILISETCDTYFEVINLYDKFMRYTSTVEYNGRSYAINTNTTNYYRLTLTISDVTE